MNTILRRLFPPLIALVLLLAAPATASGPQGEPEEEAVQALYGLQAKLMAENQKLVFGSISQKESGPGETQDLNITLYEGGHYAFLIVADERCKAFTAVIRDEDGKEAARAEGTATGGPELAAIVKIVPKFTGSYRLTIAHQKGDEAIFVKSKGYAKR